MICIFVINEIVKVINNFIIFFKQVVNNLDIEKVVNNVHLCD
jgi:hypothetical protein